MELKIFIKDIQEYYGLIYSDGILKHLLKYLDSTNINLEELFQKTIKKFSGQYKTLPDIAVFENYGADKEESVEFQYPKIESPISGYIDNLYKEFGIE